MERAKVAWSEHVILIDTEFLDALLLDFVKNFGKMLNRPIGKLNLCHWLDCLLLDASIEAGEHDNFVAFLHPMSSKGLQWAEPGNFQKDLTEKAFQDRLGEFTLSSIPIEKMVSRGEFMTEALKAAMDSETTRQILVVGDFASYGEEICMAAREESSATVTLFGMAPLPEGKYKQQILGYSVMSGLGIRADEL